VVLGLSAVRGPAPVAQALYEETAESLAAREAAEQRRLGVSRRRPSSRAGRPSATAASWPTGSAGAPALDDESLPSG
jgi:ribosome-associated heat shock protein Hsp15